MNDYQQARARSADAQQLVTNQANLFLFDLKNEASEHGFKDEDSWTLQLATDEDITSLKRFHHPMVFLKLRPESLLNVFQQVKDKLQQALSKEELALTANDVIRD